MQNKAVDILTSQGHFYIDLSLDRILKVLSILENPQDKLNCIHVAGTNGKGSVCSILSTVLQKKGFNVGLYTSPHIFEYNERIKINGKNISDKDFEDLVLEITDISKKNNIHLTEFEILTTVAFVYFEKNKVDYVVLETGLGGRLDATNVIKKNICSIITHIDLEHTERLGDTIDKISFEKAGIIKENCPVIIGENNKVIEKIAQIKNSKIYMADLTNRKCSLKGLHQKFNLSLALKACEILNINPSDEDLMCVKNPCRFEYLDGYNILVDVAHNPNSTEVLRKNLDKYYPDQNFNFIFGCLKTKDYKKMLKNLLRNNDQMYVYEFSNANSCKFSDLQKVTTFNLKNFFEYKKDKNLTVICGSFYMIKELFNDMTIKYNINSQLV